MADRDIKNAAVLLKDKQGHTAVIRQLSSNDLARLNSAVAKVSDNTKQLAAVKTAADNTAKTLAAVKTAADSTAKKLDTSVADLTKKISSISSGGGISVSPDTKGAVAYYSGLSYPVNNIGTPGAPGFGAGIAPFSLSELKNMGMTPLPGFSDPYSPNFGNYLDERCGVYVWIPKFYMRYGYNKAPQYSTYGVNSLEVSSDFATTAAAEAAGYFLHEAFIDGGKEKEGFFSGKYHTTFATVDGHTNVPTSGSWKADVNQPIGTVAPAGASASIQYWQMMKYFEDARVNNFINKLYQVESVYQKAAVDLIAIALGQVATNKNFCAWYDPTGENNNPNAGRGSSNMGLYAHNGQPCGVIGYEYLWELAIGLTTAGASATAGQSAVTDNTIFLFDNRKHRISELTSGWGNATDAWGSDSSLTSGGMYIKHTSVFTLNINRTQLWGNGTNPVFTDPKDVNGRRLFGVLPRNDNAVSPQGTKMMDKSQIYTSPTTKNMAFFMRGQTVYSNYHAMAFARTCAHWRVDSPNNYGCRPARYAD